MGLKEIGTIETAVNNYGMKIVKTASNKADSFIKKYRIAKGIKTSKEQFIRIFSIHLMLELRGAYE